MKILRVAVIVGALLCVSFSGVYAWSWESLFLPQNSLTGKPAPDFTLKTTGGQDLNLTEFRASQKAIIFFWATWCPHCRTALKDLNRDAADIQKRNIKLILVDIQEENDVVKAYLKRSAITMDVFLDLDAAVSESYGIVGVPTFVFVNESGIVKSVEHSLPADYEAVFKR